VEKESEDGEECKAIVKVNSSCEMDCVLIVTEHGMQDALCIRRVRIKNKVVPEIHVAALLQLKAPARTISVEPTLTLNPWCFGAKKWSMSAHLAHILPSAKPSMIH